MYNRRRLRKIHNSPGHCSEMDGSSELTESLLAWQKNDKQVLEKLIPRVYSELHRLARYDMSASSTD